MRDLSSCYRLPNGAEWRVWQDYVQFLPDCRGCHWWHFVAEVLERATNQYRIIRVLMPSVVNPEIIKEIGRLAVWDFLNNNRQKLARSRVPFTSYIRIWGMNLDYLVLRT